MAIYPYSEIRRIAFELSNRCVLAKDHLRCPAHQKLDEPTMNLRSEIVDHVIRTVKLNWPNYSGYVYFHLYNEPMADPRLFMFIQKARSAFPKARIQITTSGWNLDQILLDELARAGANWVRVSTYSAKSLSFLKTLKAHGLRLEISKPKGGEKFFKTPDDEAWKHVLRTDIPAVYDSEPIHHGKRCQQPYRELCIASSGEVILCCMDWKRTVVFGDLNPPDRNLHEILAQSRMKEIHEDLKHGRRKLGVCMRCSHAE